MPVLVDDALDRRKVLVACRGEGGTWVHGFGSIFQEGLSGHVRCLPELAGGFFAGVTSGKELLLDLFHS